MTLWQLLVAFFHPLDGAGYQMWSGILGSFIVGGGIWASLAHAAIRHNCHVHRCPWPARFTHPDGHRVCKKHMPNERIPGHPDFRDARLRGVD